MLTELDRKLIEREAHRFDTKEVKRWLNPLGTCYIVPSIEVLKDKYNLHELTEHWYDSMPKFDNITCDLCDNMQCEKCSTWQEWQNSEDKLTYNNWIDVFGPGIWGQTQKEVNNLAFSILEDKLLNDKEFCERAWYYQPSNENYFHIFYYNRDTENEKDYWFIFEKRKARLKT